MDLSPGPQQEQDEQNPKRRRIVIDDDDSDAGSNPDLLLNDEVEEEEEEGEDLLETWQACVPPSSALHACPPCRCNPISRAFLAIQMPAFDSMRPCQPY